MKLNLEKGVVWVGLGWVVGCVGACHIKDRKLYKVIEICVPALPALQPLSNLT